MPPAKSRLAQEDGGREISATRERQIAAAAHARSKKNNNGAAHASTLRNGAGLKTTALVQPEASNAVTQGAGVSSVH